MVKKTALFVCVLLLAIVISACTPNGTKVPASANKQATYVAQPAAAPFDALSYYQENYPMTWGYIRKNADNPASYVKYYHQVWGDMQAYTGDGINFDTLTRYEQSLVNYPRIGSYVYFASKTSKEYHSTSKCYSLLKSNPISRPASQRHNYNPCSKCVKQ